MQKEIYHLNSENKHPLRQNENKTVGIKNDGEKKEEKRGTLRKQKHSKIELRYSIPISKGPNYSSKKLTKGKIGKQKKRKKKERKTNLK